MANQESSRVSHDRLMTKLCMVTYTELADAQTSIDRRH